MVLYRPPKRARVVERRFDLERFGGGGYPAVFSGPFRSNVREFLSDYGQAVAPPLAAPGVERWSIPLVDSRRGGGEQWLDVIEESPFVSGAMDCCHCRIVGWSRHPVCGARYHFILHSPGKLKALGVGKGYKLCGHCGSVIAASTSRCPKCGLSSSRTIVVENTTHLLHGVLHSNGYGHLLRVNGREGGSSSLTGREIMDLWDRICGMLRARKVSVLDASKKFGTSFRLLHAVAKGQPWYGLWGYGFGRGSYGISEAAYKKAVSQIATTPVGFLLDLKDEKLGRIVKRYQEGRAGNLQELVSRMIDLLHVLRNETGSETAAAAPAAPAAAPAAPAAAPAAPAAPAAAPAADAAAPAPAPAAAAAVPGDVIPPLPAATATVPNRNSKRWSVKRLDKVLDVLVTALREFGLNEWMPRIKLRDQARLHIGDTGLLDHSLCSFVGRTVGDLVVERRRVEQTRQLEYRLANIQKAQTDERDRPNFGDVLSDLQYLYNQVLLGGRLRKDHPLAQAGRTILDSKHFIKDYSGRSVVEENEIFWDVQALRVECRIEPAEQTVEYDVPGELVVLARSSCTVGDLKREGVKAFRDVYPGFAQLRVLSIPALEGEADDRPVEVQRGVVTLRVDGMDKRFLAGGVDEWVVNCRCGARDDDGERMAACDSCGVWSHTRCAQIQDGDDVPEQFFCRSCRGTRFV